VSSTNDSPRPVRANVDRLRALAFACLPHHLLSRTVLRLTRLRTRAAVPVMRWFIRRFELDMTEAAEPDPARYEHFNAFFTRALRDGVRPLTGDADTLVSPVDGRVSQAGRIHRDRLVQAKGNHFSLSALLGGDPEAARALEGGIFATLYLAPGDYHRIHMPLAGNVTAMRYVPGRLYSVAPWTVRSVHGLFTRNERVCVFFDTIVGPVALVLVGALNVGAIETSWAGLITPPPGSRIVDWDYSRPGIRLQRGDEAGRFNMGSTVVVAAPRRVVLAEAAVTTDKPIRMGQALGHVVTQSS